MLGIAIGFSDQVGARCRFHDRRLRPKELVDKLVFKKYVLLWRPNLCKMQGQTTLRQQADLWIQIKKRAHKCLTGTNPGRDKPGGAREHILGTENQNFNKYGLPTLLFVFFGYRGRSTNIVMYRAYTFQNPG
jgi:hypothetical protein